MKNLKKLSFGAFAFILGLTLVLTQSAFKGSPIKAFKRIPVTVYYHGPDFTKAEVENEANWTTTNNSESCDSQEQKACRLNIDNSFVSSGQLQSSANLSALPYTNPITSEQSYYVETSSDTNMEPINRTQ